MTRWTQLVGGTAMACALTSTTAFADITGAEVWADWQTYMSEFGYQIKANEVTSGDTLTVTDLVTTMELPEDEGRINMTWPKLTFTDQGDGTVALGFPEKATMQFDVRPAAGESAVATVEMDMSDMSTIVSGDTGSLNYDYSAASISIALTDLEVQGEAPDEVIFEVSLNDVSGSSTMDIGEMRDVQQSFEAETTTYNVRFIDASEDANIIMTGAVEGMRFEGEGSIPTEYDATDPTAFFNAGFAFAGTFAQDGAQASVQAVADGDPFSMEMSSGSGSLDMALGEDGFDYTGKGDDISVSLAGADIPLPVSFTMEEAGYTLKMPLTASEDDKEFGFGMTLGGLVVPDLLWNLFDPAVVLPREPATVAFDLTGQMRLFQDLMDPSIEEADEFPGELKTLQLNDLVVELAGAELTGSGDFTFDNSDMESFDGFPRPEGAADFRLLGGNGLLDNLIKMGIVSEQDALGARMMMGLFTRPGSAEDELTSRIEVTEEGNVLANGQRIK